MSDPARAAVHRSAMSVVALLAIAAGTRAAQPPPDDGPIIVGEHAGEWKGLDVQYLHPTLDLYARYESDSQTTRGQPKQTQRDLLLRASTTIDFNAYIGHKNLIELTGSFQIGYEDENIHSSIPGQDSHTGSLADLYNIQARIFGESRVPITLYSLRDETIQNREFASSLKTDTTEHGAIAEFRSDFAPARAQYFHREQNQSDPLGQVDSNQTQDTFLLQGNVHLAENQRLDYNYTFDHVDESQGSLFHNTFDRHDGSIIHTLNFGPANEDTLRSSLRLYNETGLYEQTRIHFDEQLFLHHSDRLETRYNLTLEDQDYNGIEQRQVFGSASVKHKLFDSVISNATVGATYFEVPSQFTSTSEYFNGTIDYTKLVPYGTFNASVGAGFNHQGNSERGGTLTVFDEPHTFNDPSDIVIVRTNIVAVTITDLAHVPKLNPRDYTVRYFPDRIEIHREQFGTILNGQAVLVTYTVGPEPGNSIDTLNGSFSLRYTIDEGFLSGLSGYLYYQRIAHSVDAVDPSRFILDEGDDWRYGLEYKRSDIYLLVERQNHDSNVSPYDQMRYSARYDRRFDRLSNVSVEFVRDEIHYKTDNDHVDLSRIIGRYNEELSAGLNLQVYLQYRDEHDGRNGNVHGFEQGVDLIWRVRQTRMFATFHNSMLSGGGNDRTIQTMTVGFSRSF